MLLTVLLLSSWGLAEIAFVLMALVVGLRGSTAIWRDFLEDMGPVCLCLLALVAIGLHGLLAHAAPAALKDVWYFAKVPLELAFGYFVGRRRGIARTLGNYLLAAFVVSVAYLVPVILDWRTYVANSLYDNRVTFGGGSVLFALPITLVADRYLRGIVLLSDRRKAGAVLGLVVLGVLSVILSGGRTNLVAIVILAFCALHVFLASRRGVLAAGAALGLVVLLVATVRVVDLANLRSAVVRVPLVGRALDEVSTGADFSTAADVNTKWRGFEARLAMDTFGGFSLPRQAMGGGFGQTVALDAPRELGGVEFSEIPHLHNGYVYLLVKTGVVGLSLFVASLLLLWRALRRASPVGTQSLMALWLTLMLAVTTLVIAGPFNKSAVMPITLLCGCWVGQARGWSSARWRTDRRAARNRPGAPEFAGAR